jgi:hypothetical protein
LALTRAQLLAGDSSQGVTLVGQVQGVKEGIGVDILPDGTINFDASSATGVMRLNNPTAYNAYAWPSLSGAPAAGTILQSDGAGGLLWTGNYVQTVGTTPATASVGAAVLPAGGLAQRPLTSVNGYIRFNTDSDLLEYFDGTNWVSVVSVGPTPSTTVGLGLAVSGTAIKVSIPIQFGPPAAGTLPAEAIDGSMYWDDNLGLLFIRYYDGTSTQWVQVVPSGGGGSGTVTSVGLASAGAQSGIAVSGATSPITTSGTYNLAIDVANLPLLP